MRPNNAGRSRVVGYRQRVRQKQRSRRYDAQWLVVRTRREVGIIGNPTAIASQPGHVQETGILNVQKRANRVCGELRYG